MSAHVIAGLVLLLLLIAVIAWFVASLVRETKARDARMHAQRSGSLLRMTKYSEEEIARAFQVPVRPAPQTYASALAAEAARLRAQGVPDLLGPAARKSLGIESDKRYLPPTAPESPGLALDEHYLKLGCACSYCDYQRGTHPLSPSRSSGWSYTPASWETQ